ncbi:MAG TPA: hypothetical protein VGH29_07970, partial [Candidatus Binataceae bacterium]
MAVGSGFVVQFINTFIAVYDKNGNLASGFPKSADTFFNLPAGTYTTDPRGFFDQLNRRFVFTMLTESSPTSGTNTGALLIAASKTADPRGGWWVFNPITIGNAGECPDYDTLGNDSTWWGPGATKGGFYVGINQFSGSGHCTGASFSGNYLFLFPKDPIYNGSNFGFWFITGFNFGGTLVDTLQPANVSNSNVNHPASIFLVDSKNIDWLGNSTLCSGFICNGLHVWTISGPAATPNNPFAFLGGGSGPSAHGITVGTAHNYSFPPSADEPNGNGGVCKNCVDTGDTRISGQVQYNAGALWGAFETASGT